MSREPKLPLLADCPLSLQLSLGGLMLSMSLLGSLRSLRSMTMRRGLSML
jgi:hypothetical protein